jgi:hypothetical protein
MSRHKQLSIFEREKELKRLVEDCDKLGFAPELKTKYESQLKEVSAEIEREKAKKLNFNRVERGLVQE